MANTESTAVANFYEFLRKAAMQSRNLLAAADDLKADNDRAARDQTERDYAKLSEMVERIGLCNVVTLLANVAEEQRDDNPGVSDWSTAMDVLAKAAEAVDLKYEEPESGPCEADIDASRAAIKAGRGTRGDYERMRRSA